MSFHVSFTGLNSGKALTGDAFHALDDGADIRELTQALISDISNEAAQVFGYDRITVAKRWLTIQWDLKQPVGRFYNAGIYSATGELVYSPQFLADVVNAYGKDALVAILCHEVGHRMVYLLLTREGIPVNSWENEYCADYIAGLLVRLGNVSPTPMVRFFLEQCPNASASHPAGEHRAIIFQKGYRMIDTERSCVFLRTPAFARTLDTRHIFTPAFTRKKLLEDVLRR